MSDDNGQLQQQNAEEHEQKYTIAQDRLLTLVEHLESFVRKNVEYWDDWEEDLDYVESKGVNWAPIAGAITWIVRDHLNRTPNILNRLIDNGNMDYPDEDPQELTSTASAVINYQVIDDKDNNA